MSTTETVGNGADVLFRQLEDQGVDCMFASPIAVMALIWEALTRRGEGRLPRYFRCRHEILAVGYYKVTAHRKHVRLHGSV
jgi:acetolactate synthase-1/2/3 large subunit